MISRVKYLLVIVLLTIMTFQPSQTSAQSEAGGIFLLIPPGARAGGMGEAHVAVANDAYASYWNPAGLAFLEGRELAAMHVNWLPGLVDDIYYEFAAYRQHVPSLGTFGAHISYLNLGEQIQTGLDSPEALGTFRSYMWNGSVSFGRPIGPHAAVGGNLKIYHQFLAPASASDELEEDGAATSVALDLGFIQRGLLNGRLSFGATLTNIGPNISFLEEGQADPPPMTLRLGVNAGIIRTEGHRLNVVYDASKLLAARDDEGKPVPAYQALFTSWTDQGGQAELEQILHNVGAEYWFNDMLALRVGGMYQVAGELRTDGGAPIPTFGAGVRYQQYGFDFGYIAGDKDHPLTNTMRFSLNLRF